MVIHLINEMELGIDKMVDETEKAFLQSCEYHKTNKYDLDYFRTYIFNLICMLNKRLDLLENERKDK